MFKQEPIQTIQFQTVEPALLDTLVIQGFIFIGLLAISAGLFMLVPSNELHYVAFSISPLLLGVIGNIIRRRRS